MTEAVTLAPEVVAKEEEDATAFVSPAETAQDLEAWQKAVVGRDWEIFWNDDTEEDNGGAVS